MITKLLALSLILLLPYSCHAGVVPSPYPADIIVLPNDGQKPILELIRNATESVWMCSYKLSDKKIISSLCIAKQCGVDVRVMLEGKPYGSSTVNTEAANKLVGAGITFSWSNPQFTITNANYIIIDHRKIVLLTLDLTEESLAQYRGYGVFIGDPKVVREAEAVFIADWQKHEKKEYASACPCMLISPDNSRQRLLEIISNSKKKIWIQAYLLQDEEIIGCLIEAKRRRVNIKIILAEAAPLVNDINLKTKKYLSNQGISVKLQRTPCPQGIMMLIDEKIAFVGSQGLDTQSLNDYREMGVVITHSQVIKRLKWMFSHD
ncbi:MAG: phospholipase D-like domain-containing protein [bacterium]|nr:phospholipase D-like domain-containing protein [bacterium]